MTAPGQGGQGAGTVRFRLEDGSTGVHCPGCCSRDRRLWSSKQGASRVPVSERDRRQTINDLFFICSRVSVWCSETQEAPVTHGSGWIGGLAGVVVVGGAVLARNPAAPARPALAQVAAPLPAATHGRLLFAPACSAVYRTDGCEMARHATWKA